jgi:hypothetical protein
MDVKSGMIPPLVHIFPELATKPLRQSGIVPKAILTHLGTPAGNTRLGLVSSAPVFTFCELVR